MGSDGTERTPHGKRVLKDILEVLNVANTAAAPTIPETTAIPIRPNILTQPRGFCCACIRCGNADGNVTTNLLDLTAYHCEECGEDFTLADVQEFLGPWQKWTALVLTVPLVEEG